MGTTVERSSRRAPTMSAAAGDRAPHASYVGAAGLLRTDGCDVEPSWLCERRLNLLSFAFSSQNEAQAISAGSWPTAASAPAPHVRCCRARWLLLQPPRPFLP